MAKACADSSQ